MPGLEKALIIKAKEEFVSLGKMVPEAAATLSSVIRPDLECPLSIVSSPCRLSISKLAFSSI